MHFTSVVVAAIEAAISKQKVGLLEPPKKEQKDIH
jgi:hypothetical protein